MKGKKEEGGGVRRCLWSNIRDTEISQRFFVNLNSVIAVIQSNKRSPKNLSKEVSRMREDKCFLVEQVLTKRLDTFLQENKSCVESLFT